MCSLRQSATSDWLTKGFSACFLSVAGKRSTSQPIEWLYENLTPPTCAVFASLRRQHMFNITFQNIHFSFLTWAHNSFLEPTKMDFTSARYSLNEQKYSLGNYYNSESPGRVNSGEISNNLSYSYPKYGIGNNLRHPLSFGTRFETSSNFIEKADDSFCGDSLDSKEGDLPESTKLFMETEEKRDVIEDTNYIVKLEKMSTDETVMTKDTVKAEVKEKKKTGECNRTSSFVNNHK